MQIAICDDDKIFRESLKTQIDAYRLEKRIAVDVYEYDELQSLLSAEVVFDIVFLDYYFEKSNGLDAARVLRKKNFSGTIIFITSFPQFVYDSFEVQPFRFFVKPLSDEKLRAALDHYLSEHRLLSPILIVQDGEQVTIDADKILYLEGDGKYTLIRTAEKTYHSSKTLSQVQAMLPKHCFYRIHKSYVVNMYCISSIQGCELLMINGEKACIGRTRLADFKKCYMEFVKNYYVRL